MDTERPPNLRAPGTEPGSTTPPGGAGLGGSPPPINALAELVADLIAATGLVPDDFRRTHPFAQLDLGRLRATLAHIGGRTGTTAAQVALAWVLQGQAVTGAIVGVRSIGEAEELPGAAALRLDPVDLEEIEASLP